MGLNKNQNSGNFNDEVVDMSNYATKDELNNKADIDDVPTKISELQNDSNFLTSIPSEYVTDDELNNALAVLIARIEELEKRLNSGVE